MSLKKLFFFTLFLLVLVSSVLFFPCVGKIFYPLGSDIYWLRFHRTVLALVSGCGLALSGLVFQALFRNPLATPYTLGVASGGAFGAAVCFQTTLGLGLPILFCGVIPTVSLGAFLGAALAMGIVFALSHGRDASADQMLLAGVAVNFFFSSLIVLVQSLSDPHDAVQILRWTMGGVQDAIISDWLWLTPIVFAFMVFLMGQFRVLNVFVTGNDRAQSLGVNVRRFRLILFITTSLVVGAIVAITGPIGFVGLMVPHATRLLVGPDHRRLILSTGLLGAVFLAGCDALGRFFFQPAELPVGILTSLLGGPFFVWLLLKSRNFR